MKLTALVALTLLACLSWEPSIRAAEQTRMFEVEARKDIAYYEGDGADPVRHKLDLFLPRGQKDFPVLMFVHGGAWMIGDKSFFGRYSEFGATLARQGIGVVLPNYRLSPAVQHPEHIKDVARAFAWTVKNVGKYGGRTDQLFVGGHSAGGHLSSLLATDDRYLKAEGLDLKAIRGVVSMSGVYQIPDGNMSFSFKLNHPNVQININNVEINVTPFKSVFGDDPKMRRDASPLTHVRAGLPPFVILYAESDLPTLDSMAKRFGTALKEAGDEVEVYEVQGRGHRTILTNAVTPRDAVIQAIVAFVDKHRE